jgi:hypothetical protein
VDVLYWVGCGGVCQPLGRGDLLILGAKSEKIGKNMRKDNELKGNRLKPNRFGQF